MSMISSPAPPGAFAVIGEGRFNRDSLTKRQSDQR